MLEMVEEGRSSILPLETHFQVRKGDPIPSDKASLPSFQIKVACFC